MKNYKWRQLSVWDIPKEEFHVVYKNVDSGLSSGICRFILVIETDPNNDGYIISSPVMKVDITDEILKHVGNP